MALARRVYSLERVFVEAERGRLIGDGYAFGERARLYAVVDRLDVDDLRRWALENGDGVVAHDELCDRIAEVERVLQCQVGGKVGREGVLAAQTLRAIA